MYADIPTPKKNIICPVMEKSNLPKSQSSHNFHCEVAVFFVEFGDDWIRSWGFHPRDEGLVSEADANGSTQASQEVPSF